MIRTLRQTRKATLFIMVSTTSVSMTLRGMFRQSLLDSSYSSRLHAYRFRSVIGGGPKSFISTEWLGELKSLTHMEERDLIRRILGPLGALTGSHWRANTENILSERRTAEIHFLLLAHPILGTYIFSNLGENKTSNPSEAIDPLMS